MLEKIHITICLVASIIITVFSIFQESSLLETSIRLIFTIVLFYFVGLIARAFLGKIFEKDEPILEQQSSDEIIDEPTLEQNINGHDNYKDVDVEDE